MGSWRDTSGANLGSLGVGRGQLADGRPLDGAERQAVHPRRAVPGGRHFRQARYRGQAQGKRQWPRSSEVAAHAVREFDGGIEAAQLLSLLAEFDALVEGP